MNFVPTQSTEPPGHKPMVVNVIVAGLFKEEDEGIGVIVSPATYLRCRVRMRTL